MCERCEREIAAEEIIADRLLHGDVIVGEILAQIAARVPLTGDTPHHKKLRKMFGDRFLGIPELRRSWRKRVATHYGIEDLNRLLAVSVPYREETLEEAAADDRNWLVLVDEWSFFPGPMKDVFCKCHKAALDSSPFHSSRSALGWRIFRFGQLTFAGDVESRNERLAKVAEVGHFLKITHDTGRSQAGHYPLSGHYPFLCERMGQALASIVRCPVDTNLRYVLPIIGSEIRRITGIPVTILKPNR